MKICSAVSLGNVGHSGELRAVCSNRKASQQSTNTQSQNVSFVFFRVSTAPTGRGAPPCRGCTITLNDTHSAGLPWIVISPSQRLPDNTQHSQETEVQNSSGIRTRNLSKRTAADPCLSPRGYL